MATKKNIAMVIATIKGVYPYYAKETNIEVLAKSWLLLLQEYDDKIINNALLLCMKECEMPPTPAQIIKKIESMQPNSNKYELWGQFVKILKKVDRLQERFNYTFTEANGLSQGENAIKKTKETYNNMPEEFKAFVGSYGEFLRMARQYNDDNLEFTKNKFLNSISEIKKECQIKSIEQQSIKLMGE
jgi:hypothetical protein